MMDRHEALRLVERLKRRTRDPEVLTLCEYVHGTVVHGTIPAFRRPGDGTPLPSTPCPVCAARRAADTARKKRWRLRPASIAAARREVTRPALGAWDYAPPAGQP